MSTAPKRQEKVMAKTVRRERRYTIKDDCGDEQFYVYEGRITDRNFDGVTEQIEPATGVRERIFPLENPMNQSIKNMLDKEATGTMLPVVVADAVAYRTLAYPYVAALSLSRDKRTAVRDETAWIVFRDAKAKCGSRLIVKINNGYYHRLPPQSVLDRLNAS
jgi:hypothetical protein